MNRPLLLLLALVLLPLATAGSAPPPPGSVSVVGSGEDVLVSWLPPVGSPEEVVAYNIYQWTESGPSYVASVPGSALQFRAPMAYVLYGVSAVTEAGESVPVWPCFHARLNPPTFGVEPDCFKVPHLPPKGLISRAP